MTYRYTYAKISNQPSQHHYLRVMPESPLEHKLSSNHSTSSHLSPAGSDMSPSSHVDQDKRVRREIANCNERRRMQSINTGFQSLKILIPHSCGEKLSKACILQRAADHIKGLESEKDELQSQNEQFRLLIKSFQIDSRSVLQAQRRLSTNDPDETVLLLANNTEETKVPANDHQIYWHAQYVPTQREEEQPPPPPVDRYYRTVKQSTPPTTVDSRFTIVKQSSPSQRSYKSNSLDQTNDNEIVIVERCQLKRQSVDTNTRLSRPNLQTIVEAIRHLEGDDVLANINQSQQSSAASLPEQEDLPAQLKAIIDEKFQQKSKQTLLTSINHEIELYQKPPKKRKITFTENDDTFEQTPDPPSISNSDVHHHRHPPHEQTSTELPSPLAVAQFLQDHLIQRSLRYSHH